MQRRILLLTSAAHLFTHLLMLVYPTIAVVQAREWGVEVADLLNLTFPAFLLYGLGALPAGIWGDKTRGGLPLIVGLFGMSSGAFVCAYADTSLEIGVGLGVIGFFASIYHPAGLGLITRGIKRSAWALGINGAVGSGAVAMAPALAELLSEHFGWRQAWFVLAVPAALVAVVFLFFPIRLEDQSEPSVSPAESKSEPTRLWSPSFVILCVAMTLGGIAYRGNSVILPALMDERVNFLGHGVATSITYSFAMVMNYAAGRLTERYSSSVVYFWLIALSLPPLILTAWFSGIPLLLVAALYGGFSLGTQPPENTIVAQLSPKKYRGVAYGFKFTLSFGVGALVVPLVSHLLKHHGLATVQLTLAGVVGGLVVTALLLRHRLKRAGIQTTSPGP
jgi:MFS family permease